MTTEPENQELYQAGRLAFERGEYRLSIEILEQVRSALTPDSLLAGEAGIWLVSAYQGSGDSQGALSLCQQLTTHPNLTIRKQAQQLLYILQAPQLKRPQAWLTKIPELDQIPESESSYQKGAYAVKPAPPPPELGEVDRQDNQFIWVAFLLVALSLGFWFWAASH